MPKQTFFHLSTDKQEKLIQSAKQEFSRVPLHEASIANIIKNAEIPRGSFYQYFENKEDLFFYLLDQLAQINHDRFISILKEKKGDLFETYIDLFQLMIENHRTKEYKNFFKNVFLNMNYKLETTLSNNVYNKEQYLNIINLINTTKLNIKDQKELVQVMKIVKAVTFHNLVQVFVKDLPDEEGLNTYIGQLELLKRGLYKEENK